ncbi:type I restriction enzyme HsdR N-terminal domain-containing protein [bacterium]|nr:type I restriction enzyme HsdR N-terminal domain-containing protein [bacterium]
MKDPVRNKSVAETPEEAVRQAVILYLHRERNIPTGLMSVEKGHVNRGDSKRADLVVYDRKGAPWMVVECKAPSIKLTQAALNQVARYNQFYKAPYVLVTNGTTHYCAHVQDELITFLTELPTWPDSKSNGN